MRAFVGRIVFWIAIALGIGVCCRPSAVLQADDDGDPEQNRLPGLIAQWTDGRTTVTRIDPRPCFFLRADESPHPQLAAERFEARWSGLLLVRRPGTYRFTVQTTGRFTMRTAGRIVLEVPGETENVPGGTEKAATARTSDPVRLPYGPVAFEAHFIRGKQGPAQLRLFWQREGDIRAPVPPAVFVHEPIEETDALRLWRRIERGRQLVGRLGCVHCHRADEDEQRRMALPVREAPPLEGLGAELTPAWIHHWLADPQAVRPDSAMPRLFGSNPQDRVDLYAAVRYLAGRTNRRNGAEAPTKEQATHDRDASGESTGDLSGSSSGSASHDRRDDPHEEPIDVDTGRTLMARTGCIACHRLPGEEDSGETSLIPLAGVGSKMSRERLRGWILDSRKLRPQSLMPAFSMLADQPADLTAIVDYLASSRMRSWEQMPPSPSVERMRERFHELVPNTDRRAAFDRAEPSRQWRLLGAEVVRNRGCLNCHRDKKRPSPPSAQTRLVHLADRFVGDRPHRGCLAESPPSSLPHYSLSEDEVGAITAFLQHGVQGPGSSAPLFELQRLLHQRRCLSCHDRNGRRSEFSRRILEFVSLEADQQLRDIAPPELTAVGEKLKPSWIRQVVVEGRRARPWMDLKMPLFPHDVADVLARGLVQADGQDPAAPLPPPEDASEPVIEAGRSLVGRAAFNCVSCHDILGLRSTGVRGPDLAGVVQRVRRDWFFRWMLDPQRISRGTRMPSYFYGGRSAAPQYLDGRPETQIAAVWAYLSQGRRMKLPELDTARSGPVSGGENPRLVPRDAPLLVRGYLREHGGNRGIALGFPQGVHFGFDAESCRLVSVWKGDFLELGGWFGLGRGGAQKDFHRVLGDIVWRAPEGVAVQLRMGRKNSETSRRPTGEEPSAAGTAPSVRFRACWARADDAGFAYRIAADSQRWVDVEERLVPLSVRGAIVFRRLLVFTGPGLRDGGGLALRVGQPPNADGPPVFFSAEGTPLRPNGSALPGRRTWPAESPSWARIRTVGERHGSDLGWVSLRTSTAPSRWAVGDAVVVQLDPVSRKDRVQVELVYVFGANGSPDVLPELEAQLKEAR